MAHRSIEETFQAIKPRGRRGIPNAPTIGVGVASNNSDLSTSLSQAGQQIAQLQSAYQQQAALIAANTQAIQGNTSAQGSHSARERGGRHRVESSGRRPGFAFAADLGDCEFVRREFHAGAAADLYAAFAGGDQRDAELGDAELRARAKRRPVRAVRFGSSLPAPAAPQVTVNVNAMDSQSFMDRSTDIASAVREAMLNMHPINGVVANL